MWYPPACIPLYCRVMLLWPPTTILQRWNSGSDDKDYASHITKGTICYMIRILPKKAFLHKLSINFPWILCTHRYKQQETPKTRHSLPSKLSVDFPWIVSVHRIGLQLIHSHKRLYVGWKTLNTDWDTKAHFLRRSMSTMIICSGHRFWNPNTRMNSFSYFFINNKMVYINRLLTTTTLQQYT